MSTTAAPTFDDATLEKFEKILTKKKLSLVRELEALEQVTKGDGGYTSHIAEEGSEFISLETNYELISRQSKYLVYIEEALERIRHKTYGQCKVCRNLIEEKRLLAVPTTTTHINCKGIIKKKEEADLEKIKARQALAAEARMRK